MPVQIELRARLFHWLISPSPKPEHGHYIEYTFELATVFANVLFLLGSACFLGGAHVVGACLFFCGSLVLTVLSALNVLEQRAYRSHRAASDAKLLLLQPDDERRRAEQAAAGRLLENACYCASGAVFTLGSLLYVHRFYHRVEEAMVMIQLKQQHREYLTTGRMLRPPLLVSPTAAAMPRLNLSGSPIQIGASDSQSHARMHATLWRH